MYELFKTEIYFYFVYKAVPASSAADVWYDPDLNLSIS